MGCRDAAGPNWHTLHENGRSRERGVEQDGVALQGAERKKFAKVCRVDCGGRRTLVLTDAVFLEPVGLCTCKAGDSIDEAMGRAGSTHPLEGLVGARSVEGCSLVVTEMMAKRQGWTTITSTIRRDVLECDGSSGHTSH